MSRHVSVGEAARLAGVTIRTLHHYGAIGLLVPSGRTPAGYRQYSEGDLDRLGRILFYRELGFALSDIAAMLGDPAVDRSEHLRRQHRLVTERAARLRAMATALEREMEADMAGINLTPEEKLEIFGETYDEAWEREAEERWGDTDAWRQSQERVSRYGKPNWARVREETDALNRRLVTGFTAGLVPESPEAMALAEAHRQWVAQFADCPTEYHQGLADMYLQDPRFTKTYNDLAPGLAQWLHDAIHANADRLDRES